MNEKTSEKSIRIASLALRILINGLIVIFTIFKTSSFISGEAVPDIIRSVRTIVFSVTGVDTLFCICDLYFMNAFRIHYVLNIIITVMAFLITAAVTGVLKALILIPLLALPFVVYTFRTAKEYKNAVSDLREIMKNQKNPDTPDKNK